MLIKARLSIGAVVVIACCLSSLPLQAGQTVAENEVRQVKFAELVITAELVRALSPAVRAAREKCHTACPETGALELGIGSIGAIQSDISADTLINLLGLRLDGAGSEELNCQILIRGDKLSRRLEHLRPKQVIEHCQSNFLELRKRQLSDVLDVRVEQICRSEAAIISVRDLLLEAIKSKVMCEQ